MSSFVIEGGQSLKGRIKPQGAKNEALQVISSVLLTAEEVIIENIPNIIDVNRLIEILKFIGVKINKLNSGEYSFKADELDLEFLKSDKYKNLIKLNNIIEKKFKKNIKEISEKSKEKISKINQKNDAKKIK